MEGKSLHPVRRDGVHYFEPREVDAVAPTVRHRGSERLRSDDQVAAQVFRPLGAGKTLREIVIETNETPEVVQAFHREWRTGYESDLPALLFPHFAEGKRLREILVETHVPIDTVRRLYRDWRLGLEPGLQAQLNREAEVPELREPREMNRYSRAQDATLKSLASSLREARPDQPKERGRSGLVEWLASLPSCT